MLYMIDDLVEQLGPDFIEERFKGVDLSKRGALHRLYHVVEFNLMMAAKTLDGLLTLVG